MTDLRKAAKMVLKAWDNGQRGLFDHRMEALRQALAQPEEKMRIERNGKLTTKPYPDGYASEQEFRKAIRKASTQPEQESVAWSDVVSDGGFDPRNAFDTAPPKREWVGLTYEEVDALLWKLSLGAVSEDVKTIEAKLKEKNGG